MANIAKLKIELAGSHPVSGAYAADSQAAADQINAVNVSVDVESVSGQQIFEASVLAERNALSADNKQVFYSIVSMGTILVNGANTKAALLDMFDGVSTTRTNLAALQTKTISRADELGLGNVRAGTVAEARM